MASRLSRAEQVERNRGLVLAAARRVFLDKGYSGASVDAIADEAGFSKGVVYSQFDGKADLFLSLLEQRITERARENAAAAAAAPLEDHDSFLSLMRATARRSEDDPAWGRLLIEFRVVAARDEALNQRYAALHEATVSSFAAVLELLAERLGITLSHPPRQLAEFVLAVDAGTALERAAAPDALPWPLLEDLVSRALGIEARETTATT